MQQGFNFNINFPVHCERLFITYPLCFLPRDILKDLVLEKSKYIQSLSVASGKDSYGHGCMYVYVRFTCRVNIRDASKFDLGIHKARFLAFNNVLAPVYHLLLDKDRLDFNNTDLHDQCIQHQSTCAYISSLRNQGFDDTDLSLKLNHGELPPLKRTLCRQLSVSPKLKREPK